MPVSLFAAMMIINAAKRLTGKDYLSESGVETVAELLEVDNFVFGQAIQDLRKVADNWGNNGLDYGSRQDKKAVFYYGFSGILYLV